MKLHRRQVGPGEVEAVHEILSKCGQDMKVRLGLSHWDSRTWCMQEYEHIAFIEECEAIRLDTYDKHLSLLTWYEKLGYLWRGTFTFHTRLYGETGMACYEKMKHDFRVT